MKPNNSSAKHQRRTVGLIEEGVFKRLETVVITSNMRCRRCKKSIIDHPDFRMSLLDKGSDVILFTPGLVLLTFMEKRGIMHSACALDLITDMDPNFPHQYITPRAMNALNN